jgi:hypothetical protein
MLDRPKRKAAILPNGLTYQELNNPRFFSKKKIEKPDIFNGAKSKSFLDEVNYYFQCKHFFRADQ